MPCLVYSCCCSLFYVSVHFLSFFSNLFVQCKLKRTHVIVLLYCSLHIVVLCNHSAEANYSVHRLPFINIVFLLFTKD